MYTEEEKEGLLEAAYVLVDKNAFHYMWKDHFKEKFQLRWDRDSKEWLICEHLEYEFHKFLDQIKATTVIESPGYNENWDLGAFSNMFLARWNKKEQTWTVPLIYAKEAREALGVS
jgi:hypothetical protein